MKNINKFLFEFYPDHPNEVVVKNKFYPRGLTEADIYNHYLSVKPKLLKWVADRNIAFLMRIDDKTTVMRRNFKGVPIKLTNSNYEDLMTGRTNVVYVTHPSPTNYFVIDVDLGPNLPSNHVITVLKFLIQKIGAPKYEAILTSPKGGHYIGYVKNQNLNSLREKTKNLLEALIPELQKKLKAIELTVNVKGRKNNKINFDLTSMYPNSLHMARYSLTKEFLICDDYKKGLKRVKRK